MAVFEALVAFFFELKLQQTFAWENSAAGAQLHTSLCPFFLVLPFGCEESICCCTLFLPSERA